MVQKRVLPIDFNTLLLLPATTVLVSCVGQEAKPNIITIGGCGVASSKPPLIGVALGTGQYSLELIEETGDFVVNVPPLPHGRGHRLVWECLWQECGQVRRRPTHATSKRQGSFSPHR